MRGACGGYFPSSYRESRTRFRDYLGSVQSIWPNAKLGQRIISEEQDLTVDWIKGDSLRDKKQILLLTSGLHGIEGFPGSAMIELFFRNYLSKLDPEHTGILLVHPINPWGMANLRRVNANNVDLNRNFMPDPETFQKIFNPDYVDLNLFLNPNTKVKNLTIESIRYIIKLAHSVVRYNFDDLRAAVLLGQQSHPEGLYFSGKGYQPETILVMDLIEDLFKNYQSLIHFDFHTGYGPADRMSLVNSPLEKRMPSELADRFNYPLVIAADRDDFFVIQGDFIDWIYRLSEGRYPEVSYFGTTFEFGTIGAGILAEIVSLWIMISENQIHQYGITSENGKNRNQRRFIEMYNPSSSSWREKALMDCRMAMDGILISEGVL